MLKYVKLLFLGFLFNFIVRFSIFWIPGLAFMAFGTRGGLVYCIGIALIMFAVVVSIFEEIKVVRTLRALVKSGEDAKDGDFSTLENFIKSQFPNADIHTFVDGELDNEPGEYEDTSGFKEVFDSDDSEDDSSKE